MEEIVGIAVSSQYARRQSTHLRMNGISHLKGIPATEAAEKLFIAIMRRLKWSE
jgi:hypothetical protein